jgi:hypothetical protein
MFAVSIPNGPFATEQSYDDMLAISLLFVVVKFTVFLVYIKLWSCVTSGRFLGKRIEEG